MSLVAKEITNLLTAAVTKHDPDALAKAFDKVKLNCEDIVVLGPSLHKYRVNADLYLFTAEAALNFPDQWDVVRHCVNRLLEEDTAMTTAYRIRGLFVRAALERRDSEGKRGPDLVIAVQSALAYVVRGMKLALQDPATLSHLAFIGVQQLWNLGSVLYQDGTYADFVSTITLAITVLDKIEVTDLKYKTVWLFRQATALAGAGRSQEAWAVATKAADMVVKSCPSLKFWSYRMQVGLAKLAPNPKVKADAKGTLRGIYAAHSVLCGAIDETVGEQEVLGAITEVAAEIKAAAEREALDDKNNSPTAGGAGGKGGAKGAPPAPLPPGKKGEPVPQVGGDEGAARDEVYAELGLAAAYVGQLKVAAEIANKAAVSKRLTSRVYADYAKALVQATQCGGLALQDQTDFNFCTPETAHELLGAARRLERAIDSALRITDPTERNFVVQQGAVLMWNISLPLLQPSTRALLSKSLLCAVKALDATSSNLGLLRTQMHIEVAAVDADAQFVNKALSRADLALQIDYSPPGDHAKLYGLPRPLDRYLSWMKRCLQVKGQLYSKPEGPEDEALLILEQAADANAANRTSMLIRALNILASSEPSADFYVETVAVDTTAAASAPGAKGGKPAAPPAKGAKAAADDSVAAPSAPKITQYELEQRRLLLRVRTQLWSKLLNLAWESKSVNSLQMCRQAGDALVLRAWPRKGDRDMRLIQANAYLALAEMQVVELSKTAAGAHLGQMSFLSEATDDATETDEAELKAAAARARAVAAAQVVVQELLVKAATIGSELVAQGWPDQWVVCNAAITLWNYFAAAFTKNNFVCAAQGLEAILPLLLNLNLKPKKEAGLLGDISLAYVKSLLQLYVKEKQNLSDSPQDLTTLSEQNLSTFGVIDANHPRLAKASETAEKMIALLPSPMEAMKHCMLAAATRRLQGKPVDARTDPQLRVITVIEQCGQAIPVEDKRNALATIHTALAQDPNVELCARLAERCLRVPGSERVAMRVCSIGQALYAEGKLGIRRAEAPTPTAAATGKPSAAAKGKANVVAQEEAAAPAPEVPTPTEDDWMWFALLMQYQALAVVSLVDPSVQDKHTQLEIRKQALVALTNSAVAATRAVADRRASIIMKNIRLYSAISLEFAGHAGARALAFPSLKLLLGDAVMANVGNNIAAPPKRGNATTLSASAAKAAAEEKASRSVDADAISRLYLMLVNAHRDQGAVDAGLTAMKAALKILPASHHKPFWDLDVELRCQAGLPLNQTLLRVKEYDAETQARVWMSLARHSPDRKNQLFAYQNAINVLEHKPVEKAQHLLSLAQWMLATNYNATLDDVRTVLLSAIDLVSATIDVDYTPHGDDAQGGGQGSDASRMTQRSRLSDTTPPAATNRSGSESSVAPKSRASTTAPQQPATPTTNVKCMVTVIQAYYLLAKISFNVEPATTVIDGVPTDRKSCLALASHYVLRLWSLLSHSAAQHSVKQRLRNRKMEARNAALQAGTANPAPAAGPGKGGGKGARLLSVSVSQPAALTADADVLSQQGSNAAGGSVSNGPVWSTDDDAFVLPSDLLGWITYRPPALFLQTMHAMAQTGATSVLSAETVHTPELLIEVLTDLADMLVQNGLPLGAMPALALKAAAAQLLLHHQAIMTAAIQAAETQAYGVCLRLGAEHAAASHRIANPQLDAADRAALMEDARMEAARGAALSSMGQTPAALSTTIASGQETHVDPNSMSRVSQSMGPRKYTAASFGAQIPTSGVQLHDSSPHVHTHWISIASALVDVGRLTTAGPLLEEAMKLATKYDDQSAVAEGYYIHSRILEMQGMRTYALQAIRQAIASASAAGTPTAHVVVQYRLREAALLIAEGDVDSAFAVERQLQSVIGKQITIKSGLQKSLAASTVPLSQAELALQFVRTVLGGFARRQDTNCAPPVPVLERLRDSALRAGFKIASLSRAPSSQGAPSAPQETLEQSAEDPLFPPEAQLVLSTIERLIENAAGQRSLAERKAHLGREGTRLTLAYKTLSDSLVTEGVESLMENSTTAVRLPTHQQLGDCCRDLANNLIESVLLRKDILVDYRRGTATLVTFPRVSAAVALESKVVDFMRSSTKQRNAANRRLLRAAQRREVEQKRAEQRLVKQAQIEARREARKAEEAAALAAGTAKKDAKASAAPANAKGGKGVVVPQEDPDVDPGDKCGIPSPPPSDDDGDGEDDFSEDELEVSLAIRSATTAAPASNSSPSEQVNPQSITLSRNDAWIAHASLVRAQALALQAEELLGHSSAGGIASRLLHVTATRLLADEVALGHERRLAIVEGESANPDLQFQLESTAVAHRWNAPPDSEEPDAAALAATAAAAGKGGKPPAPGGKAAGPTAADAKGGKAPGGKNAPPPPASALSSATPDAAKKSSGGPTFVRPLLAQQALTACYGTVVEALRRDDDAILAPALLELARAAVCAGSSNVVVAAALAASNASAMRKYLINTWLAAAPTDASEAVLLSNVQALLANPLTAHTPVCAAAVKSLYQHSKMATRLKIPDAALPLFLPADEVAKCIGAPSTSLAALPSLPTDVAVMTIVAINGAQNLYLALHRGTKQPELRRTTVPHGFVSQLVTVAHRITATKRANLGAVFHSHANPSNPAAADDLHDALDVEFGALCRSVNDTIMRPLLGDLASVCDNVGPKTHLVLCVDPTLQPLPFEAALALERFKSVSRDISYFAVCQRAARRTVEKYSAAAAAVVLDPIGELPTSASAMFGGEGEKPKLAQWNVQAASTDDHGAPRPMSQAAVQRVLTTPPNNASTAILGCCGSFPNTLPLSSLVAADLSHLRVFQALTGCITAASLRRENQAEMNKTQALKFAELPHNVGLLLLARGIDCVVTNTHPVSPHTHETVLRLAAVALEKPQVRHLGEVLRTALHRTLPTLVGDNGDYKLAKSSVAAPTEGDVHKTWNLPALERLGYVVFGVSPDDGVQVSAAGAGGKKGGTAA